MQRRPISSQTVARGQLVSARRIALWIFSRFMLVQDFVMLLIECAPSRPLMGAKEHFSQTSLQSCHHQERQ